MTGLVREKHYRFCKALEDFRISQALQDSQLSKLDSELNDLFRAYQQSVSDVKTIILEYGVKQKEIRQRMKQLLMSKASERKNHKQVPG